MNNIQPQKMQETHAHLLSSIKVAEPQFIHFIRKRLGIMMHSHQTKELQKVLLEACLKFHCTVEEYLKKLSEGPANSPLLEHLIAGITIGETYFFRDKNHMQLLKNSVLPNLIKNKRDSGNLSIRIWSAGCSSGEEICTVAMQLCEMLPDLPAWRLHLLGTDINTNSLKKALTGCYSEWSMRAIPEEFKKRYFTYENKNYSLVPKIRDIVSFSYLNLSDNTFPSVFSETNAQDLIFCRNVLIYFDSEHAKHLMKKLCASLVEGGHLLLGASDPIHTSETDLIFHYKEGTLFSRPVLGRLPPKPVAVPFIDIARTPITLRPLPPITARTQGQKQEAVVNTKTTSKDHDVVVITSLLSEARWQEALEAINAYRGREIKPAFLLSAKAVVYANMGKLEEAVKFCQESLVLEPTNTQTYFTYAMTLVELNRTKEAETALRKTIFLDHQFVIGHFQLGLLLLRNKQHKPGLKSLYNALNIVKTKDPTQLVPGFDEVNYGRLAEIFEHEIEIHNIASGGILHAHQIS